MKLVRTERIWRFSLAAGVAAILAVAMPTRLRAQSQAGSGQTPLPSQSQGAKAQQPDIPLALPKGKKLVLKGGNFQVVREYVVKGDRLRYYSLERSAWEEIPADLVDWEATRKAEAEESVRQKEFLEKMRVKEAAQRAADIDVGASIEIAPGIFLPEEEGLYAIQGKDILPLTQVAADVKLDKGRLLTQVLVPLPVIPSRHKVQIAGNRAVVRLTTPQPEFYMRTAEGREPQMELIRAKVKGNRREIEAISTHLTGEKSSKWDAVSMQRWEVAKGVYRFTLSEALQPGEYAMAEILPDGMNLYVWDFGVDSASAAPAKKSSSQKKAQAPVEPKP